MTPERVLISVCGVGRSGKTVLGLMLGNAIGAFYCGEADVLYRPRSNAHLRLECTCGQQDCHVWRRIGDPPEERFHATIAERMSVTRVVDSSHTFEWTEDAWRWAPAEGMRPVRVVIWRDPLERAHSIWKRAEPDQRKKRLRMSGRSYRRRYSAYLESDQPFVGVSYEGLIERPREALQAIVAEIGVPYVDGQERFWEKQHHFRTGSLEVKRALQGGRTGFRKPAPPSAEFIEDVRRYDPELGRSADTLSLLERLRERSVA